MTTTMVEKILSDAKGLTIRLKKSDTLTDNVISTSLAVQQKIEAMKQYKEIIDKLNKTASHRPKSVLIQKLKKMNSRIEELKRDNLELQQSLEEHHEMLDLIMSKYKQQTLQLESTESLEARSPVHNALKETELRDMKIQEMVSVMLVASEKWHEDETVVAERERLIKLLQQKNQLMRMVLLNTPDDMPINPPGDSGVLPFSSPASLNNENTSNNNGNNAISNNDNTHTVPNDASTSSTF